MGNEYKAKVFKSGNSVALRLPKGAGLADGDDVTLIAHDDGSLSVWRERDGLGALMNLYGAMSPGFMEAGRGDIERDGGAVAPSARDA